MGLFVLGIIVFSTAVPFKYVSATQPASPWGSTRIRGTVKSITYPGAELTIDEILKEEEPQYDVPELHTGDTVEVLRWFQPSIWTGSRTVLNPDETEEDRLQAQKDAATDSLGKGVTAVLTYCREKQTPEMGCSYGTGWTAFGESYTGWFASIQRWYARFVSFFGY